MFPALQVGNKRTYIPCILEKLDNGSVIKQKSQLNKGTAVFDNLVEQTKQFFLSEMKNRFVEDI